MAFIEFDNVFYVWIGLFVVISFYVVNYFYIKKKKKYLSNKISTNIVLKKIVKDRSIKENLMTLFLLLAVFSLFIALANPQMRLSSQKEGVNVVLVIDSSGSMSATDFKPNRIEAAKESAISFVNELSPKSLIGVISFSSTPRIVSFLTNDKDRVIEKINTIKPGGATAIGDALAMAVDMATSIPNKKKVVILLSDGEQTTGQISINDAIKFAKANNIQVYTIGVGSNKKVILGYDWFGRPQYANLDEKALKEIAYSTGGKYYRATDTVTLKDIYKNLPNTINKEKQLVSVKDWFIWLAILFISISFFIKYWKRIKVW
jgi:Ca-activated chloride channel family protein